MSTPEDSPDDASWQAALNWWLALRESPDDQQLRQALQCWLASDERHRRAYRQAEWVWAAAESATPQPLPRPQRSWWPLLIGLLLIALCVLVLEQILARRPSPPPHNAQDPTPTSLEAMPARSGGHEPIPGSAR